MNKIYSITLSSILFASCATLVGNGRIQSQTRETGPFQSVQSSASVDVDIKKGTTQSVILEGDENLLQYLTTEVKDGNLIIGLKPHVSFGNSHLNAHVVMPVLKNITVSGSATVVSRDSFENDGKAEFTVTGSGDLDAVVHCPSITADVAGSGSLQLRGETKNADVSVSGSGDVKCHDLKSETTSVAVSGSGSAHVYASLTLKAQVSGSGDIYYSGNPATPTISKSGSGSIQAEK